MKRITIFALLCFSFSAFAKSTDPNNYFKDRKWTVDGGKFGTLFVSSTYVGEPVHLPNHLKIDLKCPGKKKTKKVAVIKKLKYCGIDAVSVIGGKVELMITNYNPADSRGYCTIRQKRYFPLPSCK